MNFIPLLTTIAALATAALSSSCSGVSSGGSRLSDYQAYNRPASLPVNPDAVQVKVSLSRQRVYVVEGSEILLAMPVSIGAPDTPTPKGNFTISKKEHKHRASSHGYAYQGDDVRRMALANRPPGYSFKGTPLPYWCEIKADYGFHTGWIKHHPCTNGCIRMHENLAPKFYRLLKVGTPVNISYTQPEDSTVANFPLPPDAGPLPDYPDSMFIGDGYFDQHAPVSFE